MVRFIIKIAYSQTDNRVAFTFQYGQIYYVIKNDITKELKEFTFQYGQIYYPKIQIKESFFKMIYIPIWLDLL